MKKQTSVVKFSLTMLLCAVLGGLAAAVLLKIDGPSLAAGLSQGLIIASPWALGISVAVCLAVAFIYKKRAQRHLSQWGLEDEAHFEQIDRELSLSMIVLTYLYVAAFLFFGIFVAGMEIYSHAELSSPQLSVFALTLAIFIIGAFVGIYLQTQLVGLTKALYPDKKGDPLSSSFTKEWLDSCDEAEQYIIYRSAYQAYQRTQKCLVYSWLIAVFGALFFATGLLPIVLVTVLWGIQTMTYYRYEQKLSKSTLR